MKLILAFMISLMVAGCASQEEKPPPTGPTKAEIKARDDFANSLPKPPER